MPSLLTFRFRAFQQRGLSALHGAAAALALLFASGSARALTLADLSDDVGLTPERFGSVFKDFEFKLGDKVQSPEVFLAAKSGDCDDFASLAADLLRRKNYTVRLIAVYMPGQTHVVCYVEEAKGYLDYNCRADAQVIQPSDGTLRDIASKVSAYFKADWWCASEFTYKDGARRFGKTALK